jgi:hypothetical protein
MDVTTILEAIAPELSGDSRVETFITLAQGRLDATAWGTLYPQGVAFLVAHMMTMANRAAAEGVGGGSPGPVTSRSAGDLSVGYGTAGGTFGARDSDYTQTSFGIQFLAIRDTLAATAPFLSVVYP